MNPKMTEPLLFEPIFKERVWGGRGLADVFGKKLPADQQIGESWEIVDRPEAQSVVRQGPWRGRTLHELWCEERGEIFGEAISDAPRFPLFAKLLDAREKLSLQVHPPPKVAAELDGEPKMEMWYFAAAEAGAEIFAGLRRGVTRETFERALGEGAAADLLHRIRVKSGDAIFIPSGRLHAIGGGNLIVEIQQNSDTTYRLFDWNRRAADGSTRPLQIDEALRSIAFDDFEPALVRPEGELLVASPEFLLERWQLASPRPALERPIFALFICLGGRVRMGQSELTAGDFFLVPASAEGTLLEPAAPQTSLLRVTLPAR